MTKQTSKTRNYSHDDTRRLCSMPIIQERPPRPGHLPGIEEMIIMLAKKWVNGTNLTYYFFDKDTDGMNVLVNGTAEFIPWKGSQAEKAAVRTGFQTWKEVEIGLTFEEVDQREDAMIRIGFMQGDGSWSYVGRDLWGIPKEQRTMNFGWNILNDSDTILHEIGHALGLPHEHQNPLAGIVWNESQVVSDLSGPPNNWDYAKIKHNVLDKKAVDEIEGSVLDEDSIMMYPMPGSWILEPPDLTDGISPAGGLSDLDKAWVKKFYPPAEGEDYDELELYKTEMIHIDPGEQVNLQFIAPWTGDFEFRTFGQMDTVMVIYELEDQNEKYLAGDDDSGTEFNSYLKIRLVKDRKYLVRLRLYWKTGTGNTSILVY